MTATTTDPAELLRRGVEWVEFQETLPEHGRDWDQGAWRRPRRTRTCGTAFCLFGYIAEQAGGIWGSDAPASCHYDDLLPLPGEQIDFENLDAEDLPGRATAPGFVGAFSRVRHLLGLDFDEASGLSHAAATAEVIRERAEAIAQSRGWDLRRTTDGDAAQTEETAEVIATS